MGDLATGVKSQTNLLELAADWLGEGRQIAIATVIETWGSAPRGTGSQLVIDADGRFEGSVSGGCVEGAVVAQATETIETGVAKMLEFGVADETAWEVGLACGGRIKVYVEPVTGQLSSDPAVNQDGNASGAVSHAS